MLATQNGDSLRRILLGSLLGAALSFGTWALGVGESGNGPEELSQARESEVSLAEVGAPVDSRVGDEAQPESASALRVAVSGEEGAPIDTQFGVLATGRIVDDTGEPVEGVAPVFEDADGIRSYAKRTVSGGWSLMGLSPGAYEFSLKAKGFVPLHESIVIPSQRMWRHDAALERGIEVPIRFENAKGDALDPAFRAASANEYLVQSLGVIATVAQPPAAVRGASGAGVSSFAEGVFLSRKQQNAPPDLDARYQGILQIAAQPPVWVSLTVGGIVVESRQLLTVPEELVFAIGPESVRPKLGTVRICLLASDGANLSEYVTVSGTSPSQRRIQDGVAIIEGVLPGCVWVTTRMPGWEALELDFFLPAGADHDLGTVTLLPTGEFDVVTVDATGAGVATSLSTMRPRLYSKPWDADLTRQLNTDSEGKLTLSNLGQGSAVIGVGGRAGIGRVGVRVDTLTESEIVISVAKGSDIQLRAGDAMPADARVVLEDSKGVPLYVGFTIPSEVTLSPGKYVIRVGNAAGEIERVEFEVGSSPLAITYGGGKQ